MVRFDNTKSDAPIRGVVNGVIYAWRENGKYLNNGHDNEKDLVEVKVPMEISLWVCKKTGRVGIPNPDFSPTQYVKCEYKLKKFKEVIED